MKGTQPLILKNIIFHALVTQQHETTVEVFPRDKVLELPNEMADRLVTHAKQSYNKDSGVAYADFGHGWLPDYLRLLIDNEVDFITFSTAGLSDLRNQLSRQTLTTGGHLFFIEYEEDNTLYMMALLLKDIDGFVIDDLDLTEGHILNLDKLHFGARININKWLEEGRGYISFLKGGNRKDITEYFKRFLCIDEDSFNDPKTNTRHLVAAIKEYCDQYYDTESEKFSIRTRVSEDINRRIANKESVTVASISSLVDPDNPEQFSTFINTSDYEIQAIFKADLSIVKKLTRFSGKTKDINISFEMDALEEGKIIFEEFIDHDQQLKPKLTIFDIPDSLLKELKNNAGSEDVN